MKFLIFILAIFFALNAFAKDASTERVVLYRTGTEGLFLDGNNNKYVADIGVDTVLNWVINIEQVEQSLDPAQNVYLTNGVACTVIANGLDLINEDLKFNEKVALRIRAENGQMEKNSDHYGLTIKGLEDLRERFLNVKEYLDVNNHFCKNN